MIALLEMLTNARKDRQEMLDEVTAIERVLEDVEDVDKYVERFKALEVVVDGFIGDAEGLPPNTPNTDHLNRLRCISNALNVYRNAYASYAVELIAQTRKKGD